jgi:aspartate-semialdehyde dehydrogenase
VFSSNFRRPNVSFAAALRDQTKQQRQQEEVASGPEPQKLKRKETDQSVPATNVNSELEDKALNALTVVHQIMKGAASEEDIALAIKKL